MRYDTVRSRTWTAAPTDVPAKTSSRPTQSCFPLGTIARSRRKGGQRHVGACGMVARLRAPLDRALLGRRRALFPAAPRLLGYLLVGPVLFLLLRRRFSTGLSAGLALACTLAPPVYKWSLGMRVDSWGLMLESLGFLAALLVKDEGRRWLPLWVAAIAALS